MTELTTRTTSGNLLQIVHDNALEAGAINVNQNVYSIDPDSTPLDRVYAVKGRKNMHIEIKNTGANPLTYKIEKLRKDFAVVSALTDADFDQNLLDNTDVLALVAANGTVILLGVLAGDTVTINGIVYTAVAGPKGNNTQFSIDGSDTVDAADLVDSITNDTRQGTLADITATNAAGVVTFTSTAIGTAGNAVTLVSSDGTRLAVSGATLAGGVDNFSIQDIVDISPESTAIRIRIRRKTAEQDTTLAGIVSVN